MMIVLPRHVDALVVVPAVLGRDDAVADEDDVGVLDVVSVSLQWRETATKSSGIRAGSLAAGGEACAVTWLKPTSGDVLHVGAVGVAGREAETP